MKLITFYLLGDKNVSKAFYSVLKHIILEKHIGSCEIDYTDENEDALLMFIYFNNKKHLYDDMINWVGKSIKKTGIVYYVQYVDINNRIFINTDISCTYCKIRYIAILGFSKDNFITSYITAKNYKELIKIISEEQKEKGYRYEIDSIYKFNETV